MMENIPRLIVLELTSRCVLSCVHCRGSKQELDYNKELGREHWFKLLDEIAYSYKPIIILSGGEALLREDIFDIISYAKQRGLTPVLATCAVTLTKENAKELKQAGIKRISLSIDGKDASTHDMMRGEIGVFDKAILAAGILKQLGIEFQINTTVTRQNVSQLKDILELAKGLGAVSFHPFFLVPVGRAEDIKNLGLSAVEHEQALSWLYEQSKLESISCRPTCAPHYFRIRSQDSSQESASGLDAKTAGCLGGKSFCFVSSIGKVYPCGFLEVEAGDIREEDFAKIWRESTVFNHLRDLSKYRGKCGECEYLGVCGGCRARAFEASGDYLEEEPECIYQPLSVKY